MLPFCNPAGVALCDHGRLETIPGTTQLLHPEEPEKVNTEVLRFLAQGAD